MRQLVLQMTLVALLAAATSAGAKEHPRLVSVAAARCTDCHADLLEGRATVHPPAADDCTLCHEMSITGEGTSVALVEPEPALCLICHDELTAAAGADLATPHAPVTDSCLTCHDPHASEQQRLLAAPLGELCTLCHDPEDLAKPHDERLSADADCRKCHQVHGSDSEHMLLATNLHAPFAEGSCRGCHRPPFGSRVRLARRGEKLCLACHGNLLASPAGAASVHGALAGENGRAGCLSCHDPHMSANRKLLIAAGPELCRQCHGDVVAAARAEGGHFPAGDDCLTCHLPHDSASAKLLNESPGELCAVCHDTEDAELVATHLGADLGSLVCVRCHTPHGSGNPKLLARTLHYPVLDGCDTCHEGAYNQLMEDGESALCLICHDDIGALADAAATPHGAMESGRCADCHNPHASAQDHLIKLPAGGECLECHDEMGAGAGESAHGIIELVGCRACHEPHGGSLPRLLRKPGAELCLSCHSPAAVRAEEGAATVRLLDRYEIPAERVASMTTLRLSADGQRHHPVAEHRVLGKPTEEELRRVETSFEGELTCLSCHDPHKGRAQLLRWDAASSVEACIHCHPK